MSARDLAKLATIIIERIRSTTRSSARRSSPSAISASTRATRCCIQDIGADGLKTGHTEEAGYGLTASAVRDGRRLVMVLAGLQGPEGRAREAERLLDYGYRNFKNYQLFTRGDAVAQADGLGKPAACRCSSPRMSGCPDRGRAARPQGQGGLRRADPGPVADGEVAALDITASGLEPRRVLLIAGQACRLPACSAG